MQILTKCMHGWDTKTQSSKGKGILGTVLAFSGADKNRAIKPFINIGKYGFRS
jgi:hypothetical protein